MSIRVLKPCYSEGQAFLSAGHDTIRTCLSVCWCHATVRDKPFYLLAMILSGHVYPSSDAMLQWRTCLSVCWPCYSPYLSIRVLKPCYSDGQAFLFAGHAIVRTCLSVFWCHATLRDKPFCPLAMLQNVNVYPCAEAMLQWGTSLSVRWPCYSPYMTIRVLMPYNSVDLSIRLVAMLQSVHVYCLSVLWCHATVKDLPISQLAMLLSETCLSVGWPFCSLSMPKLSWHVRMYDNVRINVFCA